MKNKIEKVSLVISVIKSIKVIKFSNMSFKYLTLMKIKMNKVLNSEKLLNFAKS
jgi:hypothetical protein